MPIRKGEPSWDICIEKVSAILFDVVIKGGLAEDEIIGDWYGVEPNGLWGAADCEEWMRFVWECLTVVEDQYFDEQQSLYEEVMKTLDTSTFV